jgi:hypothetical protein
MVRVARLVRRAAWALEPPLAQRKEPHGCEVVRKVFIRTPPVPLPRIDEADLAAVESLIRSLFSSP